MFSNRTNKKADERNFKWFISAKSSHSYVRLIFTVRYSYATEFIFLTLCYSDRYIWWILSLCKIRFYKNQYRCIQSNNIQMRKDFLIFFGDLFAVTWKLSCNIGYRIKYLIFKFRCKCQETRIKNISV